MIIRMHILLITTLLISFSVNAISAEVDNTGWFVGAMTGELAATEIESGVKQDQEASSFGIYGGINFNESFGLELTVMKTGNGADNKPNLISADYTMISFAPKFTLHINQLLSVYAKVGFAIIDYDENYDIDYLGRGFDESWTDIVPTSGAGVQIKISEGLNARMSYEYSEGTLDSHSIWNSIPDVYVDVHQVNFGLHHQF